MSIRMTDPETPVILHYHVSVNEPAHETCSNQKSIPKDLEETTCWCSITSNHCHLQHYKTKWPHLSAVVHQQKQVWCGNTLTHPQDQQSQMHLHQPLGGTSPNWGQDGPSLQSNPIFWTIVPTKIQSAVAGSPWARGPCISHLRDIYQEHEHSRRDVWMVGKTKAWYHNDQFEDSLTLVPCKHHRWCSLHGAIYDDRFAHLSRLLGSSQCPECCLHYGSMVTAEHHSGGLWHKTEDELSVLGWNSAPNSLLKKMTRKPSLTFKARSSQLHAWNSKIFSGKFCDWLITWCILGLFSTGSWW